ncbi:putative addiction module antidote protein [Candidatus Poribacteria bacterium]|nr:putative addiction module antidote protein [Candidatus Poribacteria bacterium]
MSKYRKYEDALKERLADPEYAKDFLDVSLEEYEQDGNKEAFLRALRYVAEAQGGLTKLSTQTNLNRQDLYKALSEEGNPRLETIGAVLHALGFRLAVEFMDHSI